MVMNINDKSNNDGSYFYPSLGSDNDSEVESSNLACIFNTLTLAEIYDCIILQMLQFHSGLTVYQLTLVKNPMENSRLIIG